MFLWSSFFKQRLYVTAFRRVCWWGRGGGSIVSRRNLLFVLNELPKDWDRNLKPLRHGVTETTETESTKIFEVLKFSAARRYRLLAAPFHVRQNSISCRNSVLTTLHLGRPIIMASARQYITRVVRQATQYSTQMVSTAPHCACARYPCVSTYN